MFLELNEKVNQSCEHSNLFNGKILFCKDCSCYLSTDLGKSIPFIEKRIKINPNLIYKKLISKHQINRYYNEDYYHEEQRKLIIFKIKTICKQLEYSERTINIAINYIDSIFSRYHFELKFFDLVIMLCVSIASKLTEKIMNTINFKTIYLNFNENFSMDLIQYYERLIFKLLNWDINIVVPLDFFEFYIQYGVIFDKELIEMYKISNFGLNYDDFIKFIKEKFIDFGKNLLNITYEFYIFYKFSSLAVSSSCIALTREYLGLNPWNEELKSFTYLKEEHLNECYCLIKQIYKNKMNEDKTPCKRNKNQDYLEKTAETSDKTKLKESVSKLLLD